MKLIKMIQNDAIVDYVNIDNVVLVKIYMPEDDDIYEVMLSLIDGTYVNYELSGKDFLNFEKQLSEICIFDNIGRL